MLYCITYPNNILTPPSEDIWSSDLGEGTSLDTEWALYESPHSGKVRLETQSSMTNGGNLGIILRKTWTGQPVLHWLISQNMSNVNSDKIPRQLGGQEQEESKDSRKNPFWKLVVPTRRIETLSVITGCTCFLPGMLQ